MNSYIQLRKNMFYWRLLGLDYLLLVVHVSCQHMRETFVVDRNLVDQEESSSTGEAWMAREALINSTRFRHEKCITVGFNLQQKDLPYFHSLNSQLIYIEYGNIPDLGQMMYYSWCVRLVHIDHRRTEHHFAVRQTARACGFASARKLKQSTDRFILDSPYPPDTKFADERTRDCTPSCMHEWVDVQ